MRIFLSGPMGSGKSTVARAVAARAGLPVWDLDQVVEQRAGASVSAVFSERGEGAFRQLERETLRGLLAQQKNGVFALGGGTITDRPLRRELLAEGVLVSLWADVAELARRVGGGEGRPLLDGQEVVARLTGLLEARADDYAECHLQLETTGRELETIATAVLEVAADPPIVVPLGSRTYRVEVGAGVRARLPSLVASMAASACVVLVSDEMVGPRWAEPLRQSLAAAGKRVAFVTLGAGEEHKTLGGVERIWEAALDAELDRGGAVVGVGGGVICDLSGFAASTLLRGVPVGHVPTTLLAMVDAAIGGKTGFDTRHGKNLIGSFHQPKFVLCDIEVLSTLAEGERRSGLAEVVKSAWIEGETAVAQLEQDAVALLAGEPEATVRAIRMAAALKARVVTEDERESGARAVLNLGHTVGHAIEASSGYRGMRHGEAVALGMVAAFRVASRLGVVAKAEVERAVRLIAALGLPTDVGPHLHQGVLSFIGSDKKRRSEGITFVLPSEPGRVDLRPLPLRELFDLLR